MDCFASLAMTTNPEKHPISAWSGDAFKTAPA
jgi:hypothetical protein